MCSWNFGVNEHGWYTYNGKLVLATATTYLANQGWYVGEGVVLHKYWEDMTININGVDYQGIILDSCGACMKRKIIDLFVTGEDTAITGQIIVK